MKFEFITEQRSPEGQKFRRNRSIFSRYNHFCVLQDVRSFAFLAKVQDGRPELQYLNILIFRNLNLLLPCGSKNLLKIALTLTVSEIFAFFYFLLKSKMYAVKTIPSTCNEET